jgi:hypothetical protein
VDSAPTGPPVAPPGVTCEDANVTYERTCDPFDPLGPDCPEGDACYLGGIYDEDPCNSPQVASRCLPQGDGGDGTPCTSHSQCAPGASCTLDGYCRFNCKPNEPNACPYGMVCHRDPYGEVGVCY